MVRDTFSFFLDFIYNNWKLILISMIGLTLALATVSQTSIVVQSYRENLFNDFLTSSTSEYNRADFMINIYNNFQYSDSLQSELQAFREETAELVNKAANNLNRTTSIEREIWHYGFSGQYLKDNNTYYVQIDTLDVEAFQFTQNFLTLGRLPQRSNETVLIINTNSYFSDDFDLQLGDEVQLSSYMGNQTKTAIITGIMEYEGSNFFQFESTEQEQAYEQANTERNTFWDYFTWVYEPIFLVNPNNLFNFLQGMSEANETLFLSATGLINIDSQQLDAFNLVGEKIWLEHLQQQFEIEASIANYDSFYIDAAIIQRIENFEAQFGSTLLLMWLFSMPTLVVTLFLASFSLSLLHGRKRLQIGILKTRGATSKRLLTVLFGESVVTTLVSIALGTILGIPLALITLKTRGFLDFTGENVALSLPIHSFPIILAFGVVFAVFLNFFSIFRLAKLDINESVIPMDKGKPFWKKYYLDVILFSMGLIGVITVFIFSNLTPGPMPITRPSGGITRLQEPGFDDIKPDPSPGDDIAYTLLSIITAIFGIPAPIFTIIGGAMIAARILPVILQVCARWLWRLEGGIIAFSFRNVLHRISQASRVALLISIVVAFSIAFLTIPYNNDMNTIDNHQYHSLGADLVVTSNSTSLNHALLRYLQNNLTDVVSVSPITQATHNSIDDTSIKVLGIDINTYAQTAFFRGDFLNQDMLSSLSRLDITSTLKAFMQGDLFPDTPDLVTQLSNIQPNTSVLVQEDNLRARNLNIGDQFSQVLTRYNETSQEYENVRYDLRVVGQFKYWPLFILDQYSLMFNSFFMISNISTVLNWGNSSIFELSNLKYLVRTYPGVSTLQLKQQIVNDTGFDVSCLEEFIENYLTSPTRNVLLTTINGSVLVLLIVTVFTILMFGFSQLIERGKEIGVERAVGMSLRQTSFLFMVEAMLLVLFGIGVGVLFGLIIAQVFLMTTLLAQSFTFPAFIIQYPWTLFLGNIILIAIVGLISSIIPAFLASRIKISTILRNE